MKTALYFVMVGMLGLAAGFVAVGCGDSSSPSASPQGASQAGGAAEPIAQKLCPVTDDPIDPKIYIDYQGRRVYFCCEMCPPKFKKDPAKYLAKLDEQMKGAAPAAKDPTTVEKKIIGWTCAMHPEVKSDKPGKCPKCGMTLVPITEDAPAPARK